MAALSCNIYLEGYWRERNKNRIPTYSGIFFVYIALYNLKDDVIAPQRIIFIGHAPNIQESVLQSLAVGQWDSFIAEGHELCFSTAYLTEAIDRINAAFIYECKPPANTEDVQFFTYDSTTVTVTGKTDLLLTHFTAQKPTETQ